MTDTPRRLLLVMDRQTDNLPVIDRVAPLAAALGARLDGLLVADVAMQSDARGGRGPGQERGNIESELLRLVGEHVERRGVRPGPLVRERLLKKALSRALRAQALAVRAGFDRALARHGVEGAFTAKPGRMAAARWARDNAPDLAVAAWTVGGLHIWQPGDSLRPDNPARGIAEVASGAVLLVRDWTPRGAPVMVGYDGTKIAGRTLSMAAAVAPAFAGAKGQVVIVLTPPRGRISERLRDRLRAPFQGQGLQVRFHRADAMTLATMRAALKAHNPGLLVWPALQPPFDDAGNDAPPDGFGGSALLVR